MAVAHNITAEEVRDWSRGRQSWPGALCGEIAERLNGMRWADQLSHTSQKKHAKRLPTTAVRAAVRAQALLEDLRTYDGDKVKEAHDALERALLEIEFPFGYGQALVELSQTIQGMPTCEAEAHLHKLELPPDTIQMLVENTLEQLDLMLLQMARAQHQRWSKRPPRPQWHMPALAIARMISEVLVRRGLPVRGVTSRNSIFVRVVREAMKRMGHPNIEVMVRETAIAKCLERDSVLTQDGLRLNIFSKGKV